MANIKDKIIVIVGTTAAGKTSLAVDLAYQFNGEVVSADSRQVYKYMDIGTGKDLDEYSIKDVRRPMGRRTSIKIPYHCIDLVHPNTEFSLGKWHKKATKAISEITGQGRVPIVAGGTGLYTQALVDGYQLSASQPDKKLRARLEKLSVEKLYLKLEKLDKTFAQGLHESDKKNKRRLIRYIESKRMDTNKETNGHESRIIYQSLVMGLKWSPEVLKRRIHKRLTERVEKEKMIEEVGRLHKKYRVSWQRLNDFGLEYRYVSKYLRGELDYDKMIEELSRAIYQFSRRQMSWLRRWEKQGQKIHWTKNKTEAINMVKKFL